MLFELDEGKLREDPSFATFVSELVERWKLPARVTIEGDLDTMPAAVLETAHASSARRSPTRPSIPVPRTCR